MTAENTSLVYSRREAARLAGLSLTAFDDALRRKQFPSMRVGRRILIPRAAFLRVLESGFGAAQ
jgi:excisionase family DNA binding protein